VQVIEAQTNPAAQILAIHLHPNHLLAFSSPRILSYDQTRRVKVQLGGTPEIVVKPVDLFLASHIAGMFCPRIINIVCLRLIMSVMRMSLSQPFGMCSLQERM